MIKKLKDKIERAVKLAGYKLPADFDLQPPPEEKFGDLSTNAAMLIAVKEKESPQAVAKEIVDKLKDDDFAKVEIAGNGFINFFLSGKFLAATLAEILAAGADFGRSGTDKNKKVLVEFISANPTGPLHVGNARGGPIGETLANILSWLGCEVEREFYINDIGTQIEKFGQTLAYWYILKNDKNFPFPEAGYPGEFLKDVSEEIQKKFAKEIAELKDEELTQFFIRQGLEIIIRKMKEDVEALGIHFNQWIYESDTVNSGKSQKVVDELKDKGKTSEKEGAVWFSSPEYRDELDGESVLVRSDADKSPTYFANDIAYHQDKLDRGFDLLIDIWGANHHGHIARMKAAMTELGYSAEKLSVILYQNVRVKEGGNVKQMSKRLGNYITIKQLLGEFKVPADVFKYMMISQSSNTIIDFDLSLALEQSEKNPLYYLQYAYARICSILRKVQAETLVEVEKIARGEASVEPREFEVLKEKKELRLIGELALFPEVLKKAVNDFQIQALPHYATGVARLFHNFYSTCQVLSDNEKQSRSRLLLVLATRNVLKICLTLMGVSAPEKM